MEQSNGGATAERSQRVAAQSGSNKARGTNDELQDLKKALQEQRRRATLLDAELHREKEARELFEGQFRQARAESEASRARRKEMARVIKNRDTQIQVLYEELAALERHVLHRSFKWRMKRLFGRLSRRARRSPDRTSASKAVS